MSLLDFYRDELKTRPIMPALLAQGQIDVPHSRLIRAPEHVYADTKPSIYVYPDHLIDFGDGNTNYDLLRVAREWLGLSLEQAVSLIAELAGVRPPTPFQGEIRPAKFAALTLAMQRDPNEHATFAARCTEALAQPTTLESEAAARYLDERGILAAAWHYGVGVADRTVLARRPHRIWEGMVTFPTWDQGALLALKGRNLLPKDAGREMRNLAGTGTAPYGLRELADSGAVLVVEGETDTLSVWQAFEGEVSVIGIPGATHWKKLQHPRLSGRHLYLCLDTDEAGQRAVGDARRWAADEGRALTVVPGIGDKNDLLLRQGAASLRQTLRDAAVAAYGRGRRVLR